MSIDWPTRAEDAPALVALVAIFVVLLVRLLLGGDKRRESAIRLASPAFVALDAESAEHVAAELGAAFRDYIDGPRRGGRR